MLWLSPIWNYQSLTRWLTDWLLGDAIASKNNNKYDITWGRGVNGKVGENVFLKWRFPLQLLSWGWGDAGLIGECKFPTTHPKLAGCINQQAFLPVQLLQAGFEQYICDLWPHLTGLVFNMACGSLSESVRFSLINSWKWVCLYDYWVWHTCKKWNTFITTTWIEFQEIWPPANSNAITTYGPGLGKKPLLSFLNSSAMWLGFLLRIVIPISDTQECVHKDF